MCIDETWHNYTVIQIHNLGTTLDMFSNRLMVPVTNLKYLVAIDYHTVGKVSGFFVSVRRGKDATFYEDAFTGHCCRINTDTWVVVNVDVQGRAELALEEEEFKRSILRNR
jgi:hypothetical protein